MVFGPGVVWGLGSKSGGELGDFSVVPAYEDDFSGILAAEKLGGEVGVVVVFEVLVDGQMQRVCKRDHRERGAVGVVAGRSGKDVLRRGEVGPHPGRNERFDQELSAGIAGRGKIGITVEKFFGVADDEDGRRRFPAGGGCGLAADRG